MTEGAAKLLPGVGLAEVNWLGQTEVRWKVGIPGSNPPTVALTGRGPFRGDLPAFVGGDGNGGYAIDERGGFGPFPPSAPTYSERYGGSPPGVQWGGPSAESLVNSVGVLEALFKAGKLGSRDKYDGRPLAAEMIDASALGIGVRMEGGVFGEFELPKLTGVEGTLSRPWTIRDDFRRSDRWQGNKSPFQHGYTWEIRLSDGSLAYIMNGKHPDDRTNLPRGKRDFLKVYEEIFLNPPEGGWPPEMVVEEKPDEVVPTAKPALSDLGRQRLGELETWAAAGKGIGPANPKRHASVKALVAELHTILD